MRACVHAAVPSIHLPDPEQNKLYLVSTQPRHPSSLASMWDLLPFATGRFPQLSSSSLDTKCKGPKKIIQASPPSLDQACFQTGPIAQYLLHTTYLSTLARTRMHIYPTRLPNKRVYEVHGPCPRRHPTLFGRRPGCPGEP